MGLVYRRESKKLTDKRAICATCGHTFEWHDRDAMRSRDRAEPGIERPCYREVGGAACRCGGFRDSGELAMPSGTSAGRQRPNRVLMNGLLTLLLVVMGLAMLYAYRSQTPAAPEVSLTQAIQDVQAGKVRAVAIVGTRATLTFRDGRKEQATVPEQDQLLSKSVLDYNAAHSESPVQLVYESSDTPISTVGSIILSLLPVLLIGGFFYYMMRTREKS
jgi:FtsH-like protein